MVTIEVATQDDVNTLVQLVHNKWSAAFDVNKKVKTEAWDPVLCPKNEWSAFSAVRKKYAADELKKWEDLLNQVKKFAKYS